MAKRKFSDISKASPEQRIAARRWARSEVAKMKLRDLRNARNLSQQEMAERLSTNQGGVSRLENQPDMYIRSVRRYVEAMGGQLVLSAIFPGVELIEIEALGAIGEDRA